MQYGCNMLIEAMPEVIHLVLLGKMEGRMEGLLEGKMEGQLETLRQVVMSAVLLKYPLLQELAQKHANAVNDPDELFQMIPAIYTASNEDTVRQLLQGKLSRKH